MTRIRIRRSHTHRITVRLRRESRIAIAALAAANSISFTDQLSELIWSQLGK